MLRMALSIAVILMANHVQRPAAFADDDMVFVPSALKAVNDIQWSKTTVRIVDPEGNPIQGAIIRPWALRAGNGHGWWNEESYGAPVRTTTADDGETIVIYPKSITWSPNQVKRVVQVSMIVKHPEFCGVNKDINVPSDNHIPEIKLERGVRLRIAGVEPGSDEPLSDCHLLVENQDTDEPEFERESDGWLQSVPIREDRRWFRVVRAPLGEPPQFSNPNAWNPDDPESRVARVVVRPGVRVLGKISDNVARPIVRGYIVVNCGSRIHPDEGGVQNSARSIYWADYAAIAEDGSFEFPSLPSGFLAQFFAFANEAISAQPSDEAFDTCCNWFCEQNRKRHAAFRYGQVLRLAGGAKTEMTIEMEPAGQVRVKCVDRTGRPLAGISVSSWPNQYTVGAGSTVFCSRFSSLDHIHGIKWTRSMRDNPYSAETDLDGAAIIRNLPDGPQSLSAGNELWISSAEQKVNSVADQTTELKLTMKRRK